MPNRNIAPRITPLSTPSLLPYQCLILANGTEIFYLNDPLQEVFKIDVVFEAGIYYQSQPLVASTTVNMLNEGTFAPFSRSNRRPVRLLRGLCGFQLWPE